MIDQEKSWQQRPVWVQEGEVDVLDVGIADGTHEALRRRQRRRWALSIGLGALPSLWTHMAYFFARVFGKSVVSEHRF
jgi:hypothetical protein